MRFALVLLLSSVVACSSRQPVPTSQPSAATETSAVTETVADLSAHHVNETAPEVSAHTPLADVIARDAARFTVGIPDGVADRLAGHQVVVLGEVHGVREHQALLTELLAPLHERGFRLLLLEGYQADSWWVNQYVGGHVDALPSAVEAAFGDVLAAVRGLNEERPDDEQLQVGMLDINHRSYALPSMLVAMAAEEITSIPTDHLLTQLGLDGLEGASFAELETAAVAATEDPAAYASALDETLAIFREMPADGRYDALLQEMVLIAQESLAIRQVWESEGEEVAHPAREEVIKRLVEAQIAQNDGGTLINIGGFHAQRTHRMGTEKVWLGEYLATESAAAGSVMTTFVLLAEWIWHGDDDAETWLDFRYTDRDDDIIASLAAYADGQVAFLPLDDPRFAEADHFTSFTGIELVYRPAELFDALFLIPEGHSY